MKRSRLERDAHTDIPGVDPGVGGGRAFLYGWRDLGGIEGDQHRKGGGVRKE